MKFGQTFTEYLHGEQEAFLNKCSHVEYKRLKKFLKSCRVCRALNESHGGANDRHEEGKEMSEFCRCNSCALCDQMFFTELTKEASDIAGCFSSRVRRLLNLHVSSGLFSGSDFGEPGEFFHKFSCDLSDMQPVMTMTLSDSMKYEYSLDTVFNPYALGCGHLFCKSCACSAASVLLFQGLKEAPQDVKCPVCRSEGVYKDAVHMTELDLLLKNRRKEYWKERMRRERAEMVKQAKEYWESQTITAIGI
ncbi:E3 ubiquitin-protein ligase BAH1-like [Musa troglodytarum]|uniref:E3 ubiquitin-protein ligase BAH1-like n=1 Tax=Musa troglodytarum TaxID=320322 RepID=A0A9E7G6G5_9LILI|nr:E3 ubiquitin-protein ligase BAH1-like [Musa troglodytarum]